jgi:hypothetical protein
VRAAGAEPRIQGADLLDLELADLIGVEDVLDPPKAPRRALTVTGLLALLTVVVAALGLGSPSRDDGLSRGAVALAGEDVAAGNRIDLDLSQPVLVEVTDRSLARRTDSVELAFRYLGSEVASASAVLRDGIAELDPDLAQRLVGGKATATVTLRTSGGTDLRTHDLPVRATQDWWFTAPAVGGALLLLLGLANLEQSLKPLRSGRMRRLSFVGASLSGAILGLGVVLLAAAVGGSEPAVPGVVATALLAAGAGAAGVPARVGLARRRRVRRAVRRAEKALGLPKGTRTTANRVTTGT